MSIITNPDRLRAFMDERVRRNGCDHTHRYSMEWAKNEIVNWDDLLDVFEANGAFCDCEVVLNMPEKGWGEVTTQELPKKKVNPWLLPESYSCLESTAFTKVIVCQTDLGRNTYANDGEILVPAPRSAKPKKRVRKSV